MKTLTHRLADWCFAVTSLGVMILGAMSLASLSNPGGLDVEIASYRYAGPCYRCWPLMGIGLAGVAGCSFFLGLAFHEGRVLSLHEAEKRAIAAAQRSQGEREDAV